MRNKMTTKQENAQNFAIQRLYIKDLSFESPNAPYIFKEEWQPEINMDLHTSHEKLADNVYQVVVHITATAKKESKTVFLIEVQQAGIFTLEGFSGEQLDQVLGAFCPSVLFPYAREVISEASVKGGFPPLYMAPVNFDAYYTEKKQQAAKQNGAIESKEAANA